MVKVSVLGCSGGIGQPLSLLLRLNPFITELSLYDVVGSHGVGADLSHIPASKCQVKSYLPDSENKNVQQCLKGSDIVLIPAGLPRKPGMTRDDLFNKNAGIVRDLINQVALNCPNAFILVISNPVNSIVPIAKEILNKHGVSNTNKLIGITTLDILRLTTFMSELTPFTTEELNGKVITIGGHSGDTIVPIIHLDKSISNTIEKKSSLKTNSQEVKDLIHRVQYGGDEIVKAKEGRGSATLSMAYAAYRFTESIIKALMNPGGVVHEVGYINLNNSKIINGKSIIDKKLNNKVDYFSLPLMISNKGIEKCEWPRITYQYEEKMVNIAIDKLSGDIAKGINFVKGTKL